MGSKRAGSQSTLQNRVDDQPTISREMVREAESIFHDHLRRVGLKHTGQRDTILRTFLETRDHLSTDELYRLVKKEDDGIGFTPRSVKGKGGLGLISMGERARIMGGVLQIESKPGHGARLSVRVPL